jgi:hypothetical protein
MLTHTHTLAHMHTHTHTHTHITSHNSRTQHVCKHIRHNGGGKGPLGYKGRKAAHMLAGAGQSAKISMLGAV